MTPGKVLITIGATLIFGGMLLEVGGKIPFRGKLPGDIRIQRDGFSLSPPLGTSVLMSLSLSLFWGLFQK